MSTKEILIQNIDRMLRGMSQEQLDIVTEVLPKYRKEEQDSLDGDSDDYWQWDADGVWRMYSALSGAVLVEVSPGTEFAEIPGAHWVWHLPGEIDYNLYERNSYCPFKAREMAENAFAEKIEAPPEEKADIQKDKPEDLQKELKVEQF